MAGSRAHRDSTQTPALRRALEATVDERGFCARATRAQLGKTLTEDCRADLSALLDQSSTQLTDSAQQRRLQAVTPPVFAEKTILDRLGVTSDGDAGEGDRFQPGQLLGSGATGNVFSVEDRDLERDVAVKVFAARSGQSREKAQRLLNEARTLARLEHPNILPIYDIDITPAGQIFFVMRRVRGRTLGAMLRQEGESSEAPAELDSPARLAGIFLKVCDALRYAHHRDVVHQDVKPDNIMIGEFGEVLLLDWGSSSSVPNTDGPRPRKPLIGTPAYMSPEQARRETADAQSDIYCVGATLFHCLLRRHATWATDPEEFWSKKCEGRIDTPTKRERLGVPPQLLAIALKALEPNPADRYAAIADLSTDLHHYLSGEAISWRVLHDSSKGPKGKAYLNRYWVIWTAPRWRLPKQCPAGADTPWRTHGRTIQGYNVNGYDNLAFRSRINGDIRVEWRARGTSKAENLNCYIGGATRLEGYTFHINAFDTPGYCVLTKGSYYGVLETTVLPETLRSQSWYSFRMEKEGERIRLFMDGACVFDYRDPDVLSGPAHRTFGFENSSGNRIEIEDIRVSHRPLPPELSPLSTPDQYLEDGLYDHALRQYEDVIAMFPDTEIALSARFKVGVCHLRNGDLERAIRHFASFERDDPDGPFAPIAMLERARALRSTRGARSAEAVFRRIASRFPNHSVCKTIMMEITAGAGHEVPTSSEKLLRSPETAKQYDRVRRKLRRWAKTLNVLLRGNHVLKFSALHFLEAHWPRRVLAWYPDQHEECAQALRSLGRFQEVLTRFPHLRRACARALLDMDRPAEVLDHYPDQREQCAAALRTMGRDREMLRKYPEQRRQVVYALVSMGRGNEAIERYAALDGYIDWAYAYQNRIQEIPELRRDNPDSVCWALRRLGREQEAIERYPGSSHAASILVRMGQYDRVLKEFPNAREARAKALVFKGRYAEALERYPDQQGAIADACLSSALFREAIRANPTSRSVQARAYNGMGLHGKITAEYQDQRGECAAALACMGRFDSIVERYPDLYGDLGTVLIETGRFDEAISGSYHNAWTIADGLIALGRMDEALERYGKLDQCAFDALRMSGRYEELLDRLGHRPGDAAAALLAMGRYKEVLRRYSRDTALYYAIFTARAVAVCEMLRSRSDRGRAIERLSELHAMPFNYKRNDTWFAKFLLEPLASRLQNETTAHRFRQRCATLADKHRNHFQQAMHYSCRYLAGQCTDREFLSQPKQHYCEARLAFAKALRLDCDDNPGAHRAYHNYLNIPQYLRGDDAVECALARWRVSVRN